MGIAENVLEDGLGFDPPPLPAPWISSPSWPEKKEIAFSTQLIFVKLPDMHCSPNEQEEEEGPHYLHCLWAAEQNTYSCLIHVLSISLVIHGVEKFVSLLSFSSWWLRLIVWLGRS